MLLASFVAPSIAGFGCKSERKLCFEKPVAVLVSRVKKLIDGY